MNLHGERPSLVVAICDNTFEVVMGGVPEPAYCYERHMNYNESYLTHK